MLASRFGAAGLERLARLRFLFQWADGGTPDRAVRGASLCIRGETRRRVPGAGGGRGGIRRTTRARSGVPSRPFRNGFLEPRTWHLRPGARWPEKAMRGARVQRRPRALLRYRRRTARSFGGLRAHGPRTLLRLGRSHRRFFRSALQPDVVP